MICGYVKSPIAGLYGLVVGSSIFGKVALVQHSSVGFHIFTNPARLQACVENDITFSSNETQCVGQIWVRDTITNSIVRTVGPKLDVAARR